MGSSIIVLGTSNFNCIFCGEMIDVKVGEEDSDKNTGVIAYADQNFCCLYNSCLLPPHTVLFSQPLLHFHRHFGFRLRHSSASLGPDISGPHLVAAVANAGALGFLRAPDWESPDDLRNLIRKTRTLTDKPFGVGVVLAFPLEENLKVILDEKVTVLEVAWGECLRELVTKAHSAVIKVVPQVGSAEEAKKAIDGGVDGIIVQGREAGGHIIGQMCILVLILKYMYNFTITNNLF